MNESRSQLFIALLLCLSLGLAPFFPEPHIWGKLKWAFGGAEGMKLMDWFDLFFHGAPWVYLGYLTFQKIKDH